MVDPYDLDDEEVDSTVMRATGSGEDAEEGGAALATGTHNDDDDDTETDEDGDENGVPTSLEVTTDEVDLEAGNSTTLEMASDGDAEEQGQ